MTEAAHAAHKTRAGLRDFARHPRRLAAGRRPRRGEERRSGRRHGRLRRRRHHHLRLRRHLHRRRGADRPLPPALPRSARRRKRSRASRCTPSSCPTSTSCRASPRAYVEGVIDQSLRRLKLERLDLVQFHWWDYAAPRWLETAQWLNELRLAGKIHKVSATNFDTDRMLHMVDGGVPLTSMQVQYSLLDARPAKRMVEAAAEQRRLAASATARSPAASSATAGSAQPEPADFREPLADQIQADHRRSRRLGLVPGAARRRCARIADRHGVDIATIASAAMLPKPGVAAVIVGARNRSHLASNLAISERRADRRGPRRDRRRACRRPTSSTATSTRWSATATAATAQIMKYNLNKGAA